MIRLLILITTLSVFSCSSNKGDLLGVWVNNDKIGCENTIRFNADSSYSHYYCGLETSFQGKYDIIGDTLVTIEYDYKGFRPDVKPVLVERFIFKFLIREENIIFIYHEDLWNQTSEYMTSESFNYRKKEDLE